MTAAFSTQNSPASKTLENGSFDTNEPMGPHVQWNLSNVATCGTSCTVEPV